jgi:hypothetical protein
MKGFIIDIALIGIIFTVGSILFVIVPLIFTKIHLISVVEFRYKYDNAQLALLASISITSTDTLDNKVKPASEIIAEYVALPSSRSNIDISFLKTSLDKFVVETIIACYKLSSASAGTLAENTVNCVPSTYSAKTRITLPYNPQDLTDEITLVMD